MLKEKADFGKDPRIFKFGFGCIVYNHHGDERILVVLLKHKQLIKINLECNIIYN